ncbi:MAG: DNA polymerase I [Nitrospirota bacterium]
MTQKSLYLIDGNSYIYRAYHAIPRLTTSKGFPTNAIYGFTNMLLKIVREKETEYLAIAFDTAAPTERHRIFEQYKLQRPGMPDDLFQQMQYIKRLVSTFNVYSIEIEGCEADDILATIALKTASEGFDVTIVTGDKDIMQVVSPHIRIYDPMKDKVYGEKDVVERFGVEPKKVVEVMGLMGDKIDNIPGIPGIGEKTAINLIKEFGSIENVLSNIEKITKPKLRENLQNNAELAILSKRLATIDTALPIDINLENLRLREPDNTKLFDIFRELEFTSLIKALCNRVSHSESLQYTVHTIQHIDELLDVMNKLKQKKEMAFDIKTVSSEITEISLFPGSGRCFYIPLSFHEDRESYKESKIAAEQQSKIAKQKVKAMLRDIFVDEEIKKYSYNIKDEVVTMKKEGIEIKGIAFDPMIASYLLNPNRASHRLDEIALDYLNYMIQRDREIEHSSCEDAVLSYRLTKELSPMIKERGLDRIFSEVEIPLVSVLADIELNGFKIDTDILSKLSTEIGDYMERIMHRVYETAGCEFNINSPKQLSDILFNKLGLKPVKKTKTGYSTDMEVLEELAVYHPLPHDILEYRTLSKLKSTYIDALPKLINPETERIHTSLNQTVTATGRLSSSEPNLQNIPIKGAWGERIRRAFIADKGCLLLSADYSQIELRILAHLSDDEALIHAFREDVDIHLKTASEIFGVPEESVTPEMRRKAKVVNFGIIYGMSPYGLSIELDVTPEEAKKYIDLYFETHKGVRDFIAKTIAEAKDRGFITTILGRQRPIPELNNPNASIRSHGERLAINTPIQGSAADIIKMAMINIYKRLGEYYSKTKMILQVHDELIFEVPEMEIDEMKYLIKREMEFVVDFLVPLKVDIGIGKNWAETH